MYHGLRVPDLNKETTYLLTYLLISDHHHKKREINFQLDRTYQLTLFTVTVYRAASSRWLHFTVLSTVFNDDDDGDDDENNYNAV